jgi:hypothetical protein
MPVGTQAVAIFEPCLASSLLALWFTERGHVYLLVNSCIVLPKPVNLSRNVTESKRTKDGGSSRNTTKTVWEVAKFRRNHVLTKKVLQSICSQKRLQRYTAATQTTDFAVSGPLQTSSQHTFDSMFMDSVGRQWSEHQVRHTR